MKTLLSYALAILAFSPFTSAEPKPVAGDALRVVATIPDLADFVNRIGGDLVKVTTLTKGRENLHLVSPRPSQLVALSRAQMFVQVGLSLETSFVPGLLDSARNKAISPGHAGFVNASEGWQPLDVPESLSRQGGDLHPEGNPHLNLDPRGGRHMATKILEGLIRIAPESKARFESNFAIYSKELAKAEERWAEARKGYKGQKVTVYHQEYLYLTRLYEIEVAAAIELRPGIPATPNHMAEVVARMKADDVRIILVSPWSNNREVKRVSELTGAKVVVLPNMVGGTSETKTWISMMDSMHGALTNAFEIRK